MQPAAEIDTRPNIVLIVLDCARRDHLSCYGYARETTPNIDRIAAEGVQFTRAYATSCWTIPSHASLFTGLYPSQHRADFDTRRLDPRHLTLATYLKRLGYQTACISCNSFVGARYTGLSAGFDLSVDVEGKHFEDDGGMRSKVARYFRERWRALTRRDRGAREATRLALDWIASRSAPFFLFINYMDCHLPYRLKDPARYRFVASGERKQVDQVPLDPFAAMAGELQLSAGEIADLQALYDGCLYYLDQQVGQIDARLKQLGLDRRTIFIVTSDHGESFGEHGLFDHQYGLYEHLLSVPLVMRLPNEEMAGQKVHQPVQHVDLFPTLASVVNGPDADDELSSLPGHRILPWSARDAVLAEYLVPNLSAIRRRFPRADVSRYGVALRSIASGGHKLICGRDGRRALYDLETDPGELENLAETRPEQVERLERRLVELLGPWPDLDQREQSLDDIEILRERLEALGYL